MTRIHIDLARRIGTVDRRIFGNFIEHLGRCIYGGIFEEGSPLSDARGFRARRARGRAPAPRARPALAGRQLRQRLPLARRRRPADARPRRSELAWYAEESNRFGTNEFIEYCRAIDTEPYICVNMGSGTMDEAQAWVEYCNGTGNTSWAEPAARARPSRAVSRALLGARQRDVRELADRQPERRRTTSRRRGPSPWS